ncbi:exodeoxyribonuclease VII small subunit [Streptomonospora alba]|nr:exodeoxyribonuclease VII small subunit [Streptomonospora alba]
MAAKDSTEKGAAGNGDAANGKAQESRNADTGAASEGAEAEMSYEEARDELDAVVRKLEAGGLTLKESLALWERGESLAATCEQWLEGARAKLAVAMEERGQGGDSQEDAPF